MRAEAHMLVILTLLLAALGIAVAVATPRVRWWFSQWARVLGLAGAPTPEPAPAGYGVQTSATRLPYPTQRTEPVLEGFHRKIGERRMDIKSFSSLTPIHTIWDSEPCDCEIGADHEA